MQVLQHRAVVVEQRHPVLGVHHEGIVLCSVACVMTEGAHHSCDHLQTVGRVCQKASSHPKVHGVGHINAMDDIVVCVGLILGLDDPAEVEELGHFDIEL